MRQMYSKQFQCQYQLHRYPFDIQVCSIILVVRSLDLDTVTLLPGKVDLIEERELTMYTITDIRIEKSNPENDNEGIRMVLVLKRKIVNECLTTYLPSVLLILITYATTFFKPFYFEAALTVNLTNMLVMTTIFIAVMGKLPSTAYVKFIDLWLIFGQLLPFAEVVLLTWMEALRAGVEGEVDGQRTRGGRLLKACILIGQDAQLNSSCLMRTCQQTNNNALIG